MTSTMAWTEQLRLANWNQAFWVCLGSYDLGCFTTGYYLMRMRTGGDVRELGSGSVGARNVGRVLGWLGFMVTLLGDLAKGSLAVWATRHFTSDDQLVALSMLAVVAGHVWPAQLRFRGGKGVATALGALLAYDPRVAFCFPVLFAAAYIVLRRTVVPGLAAFACLPLVAFFISHSSSEALEISILAGLIWITHRKNVMHEISAFSARRNAPINHD